MSNCQESEREDLTNELKLELAHHEKIYLVHQKEETIARLFESYGVCHILGKDGKVIDGKGEGMYIGTLCAYQLGYPAGSSITMQITLYQRSTGIYIGHEQALYVDPHSALASERDTIVTRKQAGKHVDADLHNVRICWSSKPELKNGHLDTRIMGRCTRVVSPLFNELLEGWFGCHD